MLDADDEGLLDTSEDSAGTILVPTLTALSVGKTDRAASAEGSPDMTFWTAVCERLVTALWGFFWTRLLGCRLGVCG